MVFSKRLKSLRQQHRLTQSDLAVILELKPTAISNYESSRNEPSIEKIIALSEYFDVSCDYLLGVTDTYFPVGGEILDREVVEFYSLYQQLSGESLTKLKDFTRYLIYTQNNS